MPKVDVECLPSHEGSDYPAPFEAAASDRTVRVLSAAMGLSDFVATHVTVPPGGWSSQRHWHTHEDEFVMVVSGELTLVTDEGETLMRAGDCAAFPAGRPNGHHLVNRSWGNALFLAVGPNVPEDRATYPDIDLMYDGSSGSYTHKDGTPYPKREVGAATPVPAPPLEEQTLAPRVYRHE